MPITNDSPTRKLQQADLYSLEQYARLRPRFRAQVMQHKKNRQLGIGPHATLNFEDRLTMQYQVQEMLRAERIFEADGIEEEIAAYNPLIPDGTNWKATMQLEYVDVEERQRALEQLIGVEDRVWVRAAEFEPVWAIADEDLERENESKTSAVHFLRFELTPAMIAAVKRGATVTVGVDHPHYRHEVTVPAAVREALAADLVD